MSPQVDCPLRICHENMYVVFRVLLIFTLCFEHEPLEDVFIPRNDTYFQCRIAAIVLVSTNARYLRWGVVRIAELRGSVVGHAPSANGCGIKLYGWYRDWA